MKTNVTEDRNLLFKWASKGLKYFLLTLLGFTIAYVLSQVFQASPIAQMLLSMWIWFFRVAIFIFCMFVLAIILESSR
ncbi:hypothetical protein [Iningainema tapete]|uniref:Uncharacterized protein n=1 Tax=Iningainema tapete BLCC-T55 TaxID=2748662 RepID=A0A8J6XYU1_9CYAN|nr:hypothetical protein [Iningainema tapete]MBD2775618.1 hypothetical protein [Iningainema tapete BLCC-T55]